MIRRYLKESLSSEAYRTLRTNIQYSSIDKNLQIIVVTSSIPGEGKSTIALNLAYSMSEMNKKVLLIDADLRRPTIHKKLNISNLVGLTDGIIQKLELKDIVQKINDNLHVMTAGKIPPNPAEIVGSEAMTVLLNYFREIYDYIIVDTPPVLSVTDSQLLALKADGTLLVVREGFVKAKLVRLAYEELEKVHVNIVGTVLNDSEEKSKISSEYYYKYEEIRPKGRNKRG